VITRDSTDVDGTIEYANILYDTANWTEAAKYYARAIARDSTRVMAIVDMGVCYYNQGDTPRAEELFQIQQRAIARMEMALKRYLLWVQVSDKFAR
jgi:tetratricopeptide (TPR) repeat protein